MTETILFALAVLIFLCWKEFCSFLDRTKVTDMATTVTENANIGADVKQVEVEKLYGLIEKVLSAQDEERERYYTQIHTMHERIVSSMEALSGARLGAGPLVSPPERMDDFEEWKESLYQELRDGGFQEEEIDQLMGKAERGEFSKDDVPSLIRNRMAMRDLTSGNGDGSSVVAAANDAAPGG